MSADGGEDLGKGLEMLLQDADPWRGRILITAAELDLFTALGEEALDPDEVAARLGAHPEATARLLAALAEMDYLHQQDGLYRNAPVARHFLVRGVPAYLGSWLLLHGMDWAAWGGLTRSIRTGAPPDAGSLFADRDRLAALLRAADDRARLFHVPRMVAALDLSDVETLVDVGGGAGTYARGFCRAHPGLRCTVFDLPEAVAIARTIGGDDDCDGRIGFVAGDFTRDPLGGPYDAAFLCNVLHGEDPAGAAALLARIRACLRPGGRLIVRDSFLEEDGTNALGGAVFGLTLMIETIGGRTHRRSAVRAMLAAAGFVRVESPGDQLMIGWTPPVFAAAWRGST